MLTVIVDLISNVEGQYIPIKTFTTVTPAVLSHWAGRVPVWGFPGEEQGHSKWRADQCAEGQQGEINNIYYIILFIQWPKTDFTKAYVLWANWKHQMPGWGKQLPPLAELSGSHKVRNTHTWRLIPTDVRFYLALTRKIDSTVATRHLLKENLSFCKLERIPKIFFNLLSSKSKVCIHLVCIA